MVISFWEVGGENCSKWRYYQKKYFPIRIFIDFASSVDEFFFYKNKLVPKHEPGALSLYIDTRQMCEN
jgi:hypothetical protein